MKYFKYLCGILALLVFTSFAPPKLKPVKITNAITVSLPKDFVVMPDNAIAQKYPSPRKPLGAFTSPNGQVDFIVSERPITFNKDDINFLKQFYQSAIRNKYSEVTFLQEEVNEINGQNFIVFEFTSMLRDEERQSSRLSAIRKYTMIQYTIVGDKLLTFTLNAPIDLKPAWEQTTHKIMQSIKLN